MVRPALTRPPIMPPDATACLSSGPAWGVLGSGAQPRKQGPLRTLSRLQELSGKRDAKTVAELVKFLDDPHYLVVIGAIEKLTKIGHKEFLQHFAAKLKHDHPMVRSSACKAIATIRNEEGIPLL